MRERASAQNETLLQSEKQEYVFTNTEEHRADFVPHEQMDARATREIIGEMLTELPAEQSQTLVYRFVEGLPLAEIAEIMDCTVSTVKSRLKYGKQKIEEQVYALEKRGIKLYSNLDPDATAVSALADGRPRRTFGGTGRQTAGTDQQRDRRGGVGGSGRGAERRNGSKGRSRKKTPAARLAPRSRRALLQRLLWQAAWSSPKRKSNLP